MSCGVWCEDPSYWIEGVRDLGEELHQNQDGKGVEWISHCAFKGLGLCWICPKADNGHLSWQRCLLWGGSPQGFGRAWVRWVNEPGSVCMPLPHTNRCSNLNYLCAAQVPGLLNPREWKLCLRLMHCKECRGKVLRFKQIKISAYFFNAC